MRTKARTAFGVFAAYTSALAACGGKSADEGKAPKASTVVSTCAEIKPPAGYVAFLEFIKVTSPTPQRFLTAAGTDSAATDDGFRAMQDKGPSYFYGGDDTAKQKLKDKLASVGPYASLLLVYRGSTTSANGDTVRFRLGGHYIGGELDGTSATSRTVVIACTDSTWKAISSAEETTP